MIKLRRFPRIKEDLDLAMPTYQHIDIVRRMATRNGETYEHMLYMNLRYALFYEAYNTGEGNG